MGKETATLAQEFEQLGIAFEQLGKALHDAFGEDDARILLSIWVIGVAFAFIFK